MTEVTIHDDESNDESNDESDDDEQCYHGCHVYPDVFGIPSFRCRSLIYGLFGFSVVDEKVQS